MTSFFEKIVDFLNSQNIPYMLSGSVAMSVFMVPRATRDFDFVVYMNQSKVAAFVEEFKTGYYCDIDSIKDAIKRNSMFNIMDYGSHYKADFILMKEDEYSIEAFNRREEMQYFGKNFFLVSVEDLLINKILWIQDIQSAIQKDDINKLSKLQNLDWSYINKWMTKLKLNTFNLLNNE